MRTGIALVLGLALIGCKSKETPPPAGKTVEPAPTPPVPADAAPSGDAAIATAFVAHLARGEGAEALKMLPPGAKITADALVAEWATRVGDGGALREVAARPFPEDPTVFMVRATLERGMADVLTIVSKGLVQRVSFGWRYEAPAYVDPTAFTEVPFAVGAGKTALPGILSVPAGAGPFPVVVLEPGSGASDLDESDGATPLMLFRDLAWGLASRGVAVLRYDKRSAGLHFAELGTAKETFTVKEEYLDDLTHALDGVGHDARIDPKRIFLLGHSQAGWLLPWMMRDHPEVAGGIIASGCARPLVDLLPEQNHYLATLQGASAAELAILDQMIADQVARAHDPALADDTAPDTLPLGIPAPYWKFLQPYDAPAVIATIERPFLVLQGGRDYNVTMVDLAMWKQALAANPDVTAHDYPTLDHHYVAGDKPSTPAEMALGGHAAAPVIEDIAAWVKAH
jgi:dienelactone hydrolase